MNQMLTAPFTAEEVKAALDSMHPSKSPGPDGINACFFQKYWHIVGNDITQLIINTLNGEISVAKLNETHIVLIPKTSSPTQMTEYRPISLCNIVYKMAAKVMANRLQLVLPQIISIPQSVFVSGRSIYDNSMIAHELIHTMQRHKKGDVGEIALKLDMSKAFDRFEWKYLEKIMEALGIDSSFSKRIMSCVRTVKYSILVNGQASSFFSPERGIRQGDPLSPYLFILCVEGFSALINKACQEGRMGGVSASKGGPQVSHLLFADDSLIFMNALESDCLAMKNALHDYEKASGQSINMTKSSIFFSANVNPRQ